MDSFSIGDKLVAKKTVTLEGSDRVILFKGNKYEVKWFHGDVNILTTAESDFQTALWGLMDDLETGYEFPFYTMREIRDMRLSELDI